MPASESKTSNPKGSIWHRWEPHIHLPGTLLNDQYKGIDPVNDFLSTIESSTPLIEAIGITDYYLLDGYEEIIKQSVQGRIPSVKLIFANVELRLNIGTSEGSGINLHLLISPEDPDHIAEARRFLQGLEFTYSKEKYRCTKADLIKLGKAFDTSVINDRKALEIGANQFKADFNALTLLFKESAWASKNILVAVSGNTKDGTAGLKKDASFTATREEIQRRANIIFSSFSQQRQYWLGLGADSIETIKIKYQDLKPCLHGCDAHAQETVGKPTMDRFSWIKGDLTFESLKQACIEPESRSYVGKHYPLLEEASSLIIDRIELKNASWIAKESIPLNSGLVAIIGARGSGKTALADLIAAGGYSFNLEKSDRSFLRRAGDLITKEKVLLTWSNGEKTECALKSAEHYDLIDYPKVQYLSQQFVEDLCSAEGLTDNLVKEIERVVFQAHPSENRLGTDSFEEFRNLKTADSINARAENELYLKQLTASIIAEQELKDTLPSLNRQLENSKTVIASDRKAQQGLINSDQKQRAQEHEIISTALGKVKLSLDAAKRTELSLTNLINELKRQEEVGFPGYLAKLKQNYLETGLTSNEWEKLKPQFHQDAIKLLSEKLKKIVEQRNSLTGISSYNLDPKDKEKSFVPDGAERNSLSYNLLNAELARIQSLIGIDQQNTQKYSQLTTKISKEETNQNRISEGINKIKDADQRISNFSAQRKKTYLRIIEAIINEQNELTRLYEPLMSSLKQEQGSLGKLSFNVQRFVNIDDWSEKGELLLDLRKLGPFKGKGSLMKLAKEKLLRIWTDGTANEIAQTLDKFREEHLGELTAHSPVEKSAISEYRNWLKQLVEWFYSTSHIKVSYGIQYDGLNIKQLSPGTRGIVLLLLYLSIDKDDKRPLIIDQPEENLDPKSIYVELVSRFRTAKLRRQIFIVTHNANLVVNTDADQVIVAECGVHRSGELPLINYISGGLENPLIRSKVCDILEGGELAFKDRAKRLRVMLD